MWDKFRILLAILLLVAVVAVCISPAVNLPETALRAKRDAVLLALAIVALAATLLDSVFALAEFEWQPRLRADIAALSCFSDAALPLLC